MPISGGQVRPAGAGGADSFVSAEEEWLQILEAARTMRSKTGFVFDEAALPGWIDEYVKARRSMGIWLDSSRGFASAFLGFAGRLNMTPKDLNALKAAWRADVTEHVFDYVPVPPEEQNRLNLIWGYQDLASSFMRSKKFNLAAQAYRAVAAIVNFDAPNYLSLFQDVLNLMNSNVLRMQQFGEKLLAAIPFGIESGFFISSTLNSLMDSGVPQGADIESWRNLIRSEIGEIIRVPEFDPYHTNAYVPLAQQQIARLADSFTVATGGDTLRPIASSLRVLLDRGVTSLVRDFLETLATLENQPNQRRSVKALIHITAAQENLTPELVALTKSILGLIRAASPISAVRLRYYIVPLAIAYLGSSQPNTQVEKNLAQLLDMLQRPAVHPSEEELEGRVERFFNIDGVNGIANASDIDALVYHFLNNLVHHWDAAHTEAARLLDLAIKRMLNGASIVLMSRALYQDMLHGTEEFSQRELNKYTEILLDPDPEVQQLIDNTRLSFNNNDDLFARYEEMKRSRRNGSSGSGGASGPAPQGSPEAGAGGPGGSVEGASSADSTEEITAYNGYESGYGYEADVEGWGAEEIDTTGTEYYGWDLDAAPIEAGGMFVFSEAFPI